MRSAVLGFFLLCAACAGPSTQIVVVVDSDLMPMERTTVRVITSRGEAMTSERDFLVDGPGAIAIPFSFGVVPRGDLSQPVRITVQALDRMGRRIVERTAEVTFVAGRTQLLSVFLGRACRDVDCRGATTCIGGSCAPTVIPPGGLPLVTPGTELSVDAPEPMSDAPVLPDVGSDAGRVCTECGVLGAPACSRHCLNDGSCRCGDSCMCTFDCIIGQDCMTSCGEGSSCRLDVRRASNAGISCDGAACDVDARDASNVDATCTGGALCEIDCKDTSDCQVQCNDGAQCVLDCSGSEDCGFEVCAGDEVDCPGGIAVCNRSCP